MLLKQLSCNGFRNISNQEIEFSPSLTYLYGPNGAGKTVWLESIYCLLLGKSFRSSTLDYLINFACEYIAIRGEFTGNNDITHDIEYYRQRSGVKRLKLNGEIVNRQQEIAALLPVCYLGPSSFHLWEQPAGTV